LAQHVEEACFFAQKATRREAESAGFRKLPDLTVRITARRSQRTDQARATYRNGVLRVELPKVSPCRPRAISIRVE